MTQHEQVYRGIKKMMYNNFLGGIAWGLGASIGVAIIFSLVTFVLANINFVPIVGDFFAEVGTYIESKQSNTLR